MKNYSLTANKILFYLFISLFISACTQINDSGPTKDLGKYIIPPIYSDIGPFRDGLAPFSVEATGGRKWGHINREGTQVIPAIYDAAMSFSEGLGRIRIGDEVRGRWGYVNAKGELVIPPIFGEASEFENGVAKVLYWDGKLISTHYSLPENTKVGEDGFIDKTGKRINATSKDFNEGLRAVCKSEGDRKCGFIDREGKLKIDYQFDDARRFSDGLAAVGFVDAYAYRKKSNPSEILISKSRPTGRGVEGVDYWSVLKYGYIDRDGRIVIKPVYAEAGEFVDGVAPVSIDRDFGVNAGGHVLTWTGKYGLINKSGHVLAAPAFQPFSIKNSNRILVRVSRDGEEYSGYLDRNGKVVVGFTFTKALEFKDKLAGVCAEKNLCGYISEDGNFVIPATFNDVSSFHEGLAAIKIGSKWGYIDTRGKILINPMYESASNFENGTASVVINGKYGVIAR